MFSLGRATWLRENEQQVFRVRRHWIVLLGRIFLPLLTLLAALVLILVIDYMFTLSSSVRLILFFISTLGGLAWLIWRILDWENDTLTLTNERIMRTERVILIREEREEMSLFRVQNVKVLVQTLTATVVGFGDLEIESAGSLAPIRFGPVGNPGHVLLPKVVAHWDFVVAEDRHIAVQILALEGIGDNGLVLHADQIIETGCAQRQDRALKLPGRGVRGGHRKVPGDVVFQDRRRAGRQRLGATGQVEQPCVVVQHGLGASAKNGDFGLHR